MPLTIIMSPAKPTRCRLTNNRGADNEFGQRCHTCYNYGNFLRDAVHSVLTGQDGVDVRVLVIDDASTDNSVEIAKAIAEEDPRVEAAVHGINRGQYRTYNEGLLEWADGDPRSPQGRIYPLACLIAIALCAFTAAGNDRFTAVGQWIRRAGQAGLARLHAPWDPIAGRYRVPDEKTIRVVLDRLDPRAPARALLGPRPRRSGGPASASVRGYRARRAPRSGRGCRRCRW